MNMSVAGAMPGNTVDMASNMSFSATSDSFVAGDSRRRNITLALIGVNPLSRAWLSVTPSCLMCTGVC